jgi:hypothetical protein
MLKQQGRTFEAMAEEVMFGDENTLAPGPNSAKSSHTAHAPTCASFLRAAGLI